MNTTKVTRSIIVRDGDRFLLPMGAVIKSVTTEGGISVDSTCDNLPAPNAFQCIIINYSLDNGAGSGVLESDSAQDVVVVSVGWDGQEYILAPDTTTPAGYTGVDPDNPSNLATRVSQAAPDGLIPYASGKYLGSTNDRKKYRIDLKIPESLVDTFYIKLRSADFSPFKIYAEVCDGCCTDANSAAQQSADAVLGTTTTTTTIPV